MAAASPRRRAALRTVARGLTGLLLAALALVTVARSGHALTGDDASWLLVQTAREGTLTPHPGDPGRVTLRLHGVGPFLTAFTDRPAHQTAVAPTGPALAAALEGEPPNAALTTTAGGELITVILELLSARYDAAADAATYEARLLAQSHRPAFAWLAVHGSGAPPLTFGHAALVIDYISGMCPITLPGEPDPCLAQ